jgi:predicted ABC-type ATPase
MNQKRMSNLYIIAGPNGSGKTTFVKKFLPSYAGCMHFVNADLIAAGLSPFSPEIAAVKAGKIMLEEIHAYARQGSDFSFETTLAGKSYTKLLKALKKEGYRIHLYFLWLRNVDLALKRIAERVSMGGHDVPTDVVHRRFIRGPHNLFHLYRPLLDSWIIFDNSADIPLVIAREQEGLLTVLDDHLYKAVTQNLEEM